MKKFCLVCYTLFLTFFLVSAGRTLVISTYLPESHPLFNKSQIMWNEIADRMEQVDSIILTYYPLERSRLLLLAGKIDGDGGRTLVAYEGETEAVMVSFPLVVTSYFCFTTKDIEVTGPSSIRKYSIVIENGNKILRKYVFTNNLQVKTVNTASQALKMVEAGRADIYITSGFTAQGLLNNTFKDSGIKMIEPALFNVSNYLFLNKKHTSLVPEFEKAIRYMVTSGRLQEIFQ